MYSLDPESQKQARSFIFFTRWILVVQWLIFFCYTGAWVALNIVQYIDKSFGRFLGINNDIGFIFVLLIFFFGNMCLQLPFTFFSSILIPRNFGFSTEKTTPWIMKYAFTSFVMSGRVLLIVFLLYSGIRTYLNGESLLFVVLWFVFIVPIFSENLEHLLASMFWVTSPLASMNQVLDAEIREFSRDLGFDIKEVVVYEAGNDLANTNAYADFGKSRISLGANLLRSFSVDEIKAIVCHEVGHLKVGFNVKYPRLFNISIFFVLQPLIFFLLVVIFGTVLKQMSVSEINAYWIPCLYLIATFRIWILYLIHGPLYRRLEYNADDFAVLNVGREKYVSCLFRLADKILYYYSDRWPAFGYPSLRQRIERL